MAWLERLSRTWRLGVGFVGLVAITETERETRARTTSTSEEFPYRDLSFVNLSIPSTCLVNPDSVCGDKVSLYRSFLFFSFLFSLRFPEIRSFTSAREVFSFQNELPLVPVCPFQYVRVPFHDTTRPHADTLSDNLIVAPSSRQHFSRNFSNPF